MPLLKRVFTSRNAPARPLYKDFLTQQPSSWATYSDPSTITSYPQNYLPQISRNSFPKQLPHQSTLTQHTQTSTDRDTEHEPRGVDSQY